jgi:REP element-mobilizing transposase RayT
MRSTKLERKNIRLPSAYYRGVRLYFLTLCFAGRGRYGANRRIASWIVNRLRHHAEECAFFVHAYCVMPDHVHVLAGGASDDSYMVKFVESLKQETSIVFARRTHRRLWQFKYYDHVLRSSDSADRVAFYIWFNPVRQGLCGAPSDYPFLGSFTKIGQNMLRNVVVPDWVPPWKKLKMPG